VLSYVAALTSFLVLDHFASRLLARPGTAPPLRSVIVAETWRLLAPMLLALGVLFAFAPPRPHVLLDAATLVALDREKLAPAYLQLAFFALIGAMVVQLASRLLRLRRDDKQPVTEALA